VLAMLGAIGPKPDLVVSGINRGPNLGTDIVYSGTCAAAREAVLSGIPGIAVSCASRDDHVMYGAAASFVLRNLGSLMAACSGDVFININAPSSDEETLNARWCLPCERIYGNKLEAFEAPDGYTYCFITGEAADSGGDDSSDSNIVKAGMLSVSSIIARPQAKSGFIAEPEFR
jgi:5'-nucleotidase